MILSKFLSSRAMHCCSWNVKLCTALRTFSDAIAAIALWMVSFNALIICGLPRKTSDFRCPQRKKSQGDSSGEWADQGMSPCNETRRPENNCPRTPLEILAIWAVAPSCWNHRGPFPWSLILGCKKIYTILAVRINSHHTSSFLTKVWPYNAEICNSTKRLLADCEEVAYGAVVALLWPSIENSAYLQSPINGNGLCH